MRISKTTNPYGLPRNKGITGKLGYYFDVCNNKLNNLVLNIGWFIAIIAACCIPLCLFAVWVMIAAAMIKVAYFIIFNWDSATGFSGLF